MADLIDRGALLKHLKALMSSCSTSDEAAVAAVAVALVTDAKSLDPLSDLQERISFIQFPGSDVMQTFLKNEVDRWYRLNCEE